MIRIKLIHNSLVNSYTFSFFSKGSEYFEMGCLSVSFGPVERKGTPFLGTPASQEFLYSPASFLERNKNVTGWGRLSGRLGILTDSGNARELIKQHQPL